MEKTESRSDGGMKKVVGYCSVAQNMCIKFGGIN